MLGGAVDLEDMLEDLWEEVQGKARDGADKARDELRQRSRLPGFRKRMRTATLWASTSWVAAFGGMGIASELAIDGGVGTVLAVAAAGIALPGIPTGVWAWRARKKEAAAEAEVLAARAARKERAALPRAVAADWVRLRRAQQLVEDLAGRGLVDVVSIGEQAAMVDDLYALLVADRRTSELGGAPSTALRQQVGDLADLLVALAAEAVEAGSEAVHASGTPATLRDAHERLTTLRAARAEVARMDIGGAAAAAEDLIERDLIEQGRVSGRSTAPAEPADQAPGHAPAQEPTSRTIRRPRPSITSRDDPSGDPTSRQILED